MAWHRPVPHATRLLPRAIRERLVRVRTRVVERELEGVTVSVAHGAAEVAAAARLVHDAGVALGRLTPQPSGMQVTPHLLLPATVTFVARAGDAVVGTASLFLDSVLGLPAEALLPLELRRLRARRRRVAEAGALVVAPGRRGYGLTYLLAKALYRCAVELLGVDDLVIAVHPGDEDYYRAVLCFTRLHPPRSGVTPGTRALVVPMHLDLRSARWTWFQTSGHLPARAANPYHMYIERRDPQITLPDSIGVACHDRREAVADLLESDPRVLAALPARQRAIVTDLVGPAARQLDTRVWEPAGSWERAAVAMSPRR